MNWGQDEDVDLEDDEEDCRLIDPNDINIIEDPDNWHPSSEYILSYAKQLGYIPGIDPKELLSVAEKYLTIKLPNNIKRAFMKDTLQILYIDMNTEEIQLETDIEDQAKTEFEKIRNIKNDLSAPPIINNNKNNKSKEYNFNLNYKDEDSNGEINIEDNKGNKNKKII